MKITRRQLRRIIREVGRSEHDAEASGMVRSYNAGYRDAFRSPGRKRVGPNREYKRGYEKGLEDAKRGVRGPEDDNPGRGRMREAEGSTKKYDDDSALKGDQSKLPDGLQKGIIDKTVEDREEREKEEREEKNESLRITRRQLRRIIKEFNFDNITHEEIVEYLETQAKEYALDTALTPPAIQELLMDDFMDNIGAYADLSPEYQELIDSLAGMHGASERKHLSENQYGKDPTPQERWDWGYDDAINGIPHQGGYDESYDLGYEEGLMDAQAQGLI